VPVQHEVYTVTDRRFCQLILPLHGVVPLLFLSPHPRCTGRTTPRRPEAVLLSATKTRSGTDITQQKLSLAGVAAIEMDASPEKLIEAVPVEAGHASDADRREGKGCPRHSPRRVERPAAGEAPQQIAIGVEDIDKAIEPLPGPVTEAQTVSNPSTAPNCMNNTVFFNTNLPPSINLPPGFTASVFASGLNMPTGIAFLGNATHFQVYVLESGHGLPSVCNDEMAWPVVRSR
jgi:hypothetical protein